MVYIPKQGDLITMDFNPQSGHEQAGRRPALVISNEAYHRRTEMAIVCPITNKKKGYPLHIELDATHETTGVVMCEQMRSVDFNARNAAFKESSSSKLLKMVLHHVGLFF
jgi:mRNA interferase MazF